MTYACSMHGEIAGRSGNGPSEGFNADNPGRLQFATTPPPRTNSAGNGGKYCIGNTSSSDLYITPVVLPHLGVGSYHEHLLRISFHTTRSSGSNMFQLALPCQIRELYNLYWDGTVLRVSTLVGQSLVNRGNLSGFTANTWHTIWVYFRSSTRSSGIGNGGPGHTANADGRIRVFKTDPHVAGSTPALDYTGKIYFSWSNLTVIIPESTPRVRIRGTEYFDDMVCQIPSIDFVSSTASLPARYSSIKYTDGAGNVITAFVSKSHQTGTDGSGNAVGVLTLAHMRYTPYNGSAKAFNGMSWGGVTKPWGTGFVSITDTSNNALGTGAYNYARGVLPTDGVFMAAAKPISASTTMTPSAGTAADSFQLVDDFGGETNPADFVSADASSEYWEGQFDDDTSSGTDKLVAAGTPAVNRVLTYAWAKQQGSGGAVTGKIKHFNVATGDPISSRNETAPVSLTSNYSLSVGDHLECSTSSAGTTTPWTITNLNAASFGIIAE